MFPVLFLSFHAFTSLYTLITVIILWYSIAIDIRDSTGTVIYAQCRARPLLIHGARNA